MLGYDLATLGPRSPQFWHLLVEAKKLAYNDLDRYRATRASPTCPLTRLTSKEYAAELCDRIDPRRAAPARYLGSSHFRHRLPHHRRPVGQHDVVHLQHLSTCSAPA